MRPAVAIGGRRRRPSACRGRRGPGVPQSLPSTALAAQQTRVLVVAGLGGTPRVQEGVPRPRRCAWTRPWSTAWACRPRTSRSWRRRQRRGGAPGATLHPGQRAVGPGRPGRRRRAPDDILVVLIGHGTAEGEDVRFNLPGPDLTPAELATALDAFKTQRVAVVNTAAPAGASWRRWPAPNRVVVAATRTARERNATVFPRYFVDALAGDGADLDKDGRVSILEAFQYARQETERHYKDENLLQVEHAVLDDNGDGEGSMSAAADSADGKLAAAFRLGAPGRRRRRHGAHHRRSRCCATVRRAHGDPEEDRRPPRPEGVAAPGRVPGAAGEPPGGAGAEEPGDPSARGERMTRRTRRARRPRAPVPAWASTRRPCPPRRPVRPWTGARSALRSGAYDDAIREYRSLIRSASGSAGGPPGPGGGPPHRGSLRRGGGRGAQPAADGDPDHRQRPGRGALGQGSAGRGGGGVPPGHRRRRRTTASPPR